MMDTGHARRPNPASALAKTVQQDLRVADMIKWKATNGTYKLISFYRFACRIWLSKSRSLTTHYCILFCYLATISINTLTTLLTYLLSYPHYKLTVAAAEFHAPSWSYALRLWPVSLFLPRDATQSAACYVKSSVCPWRWGIVITYTVSHKKCDYIFYSNFNNKCPITIIFGIVSSQSRRHRKMVSFPTSLI